MCKIKTITISRSVLTSLCSFIFCLIFRRVISATFSFLFFIFFLLCEFLVYAIWRSLLKLHVTIKCAPFTNFMLCIMKKTTKNTDLVIHFTFFCQSEKPGFYVVSALTSCIGLFLESRSKIMTNELDRNFILNVLSLFLKISTVVFSLYRVSWWDKIISILFS